MPKRKKPYLFLVQMRHEAVHCPGYNREVLPKWVEAPDRRHKITAQPGMKPHGTYRKAPGHPVVPIVEAGASSRPGPSVVRLLPSEQADIRVTPVTPVEEMLAMARQMSGG